MGYNYKGDSLRYAKINIPVRPEFMDMDGLPRWELIEHGDSDGFDVTAILDNGEHRKTIILPVGKRIIRYGANNGRYTADYGTAYERLSLPYQKETVEYHEYIVISECEVECVVDYGYVAPGFGSVGGAIQYRHLKTIRQSLKEKILKEDTSWLESLQRKS